MSRASLICQAIYSNHILAAFLSLFSGPLGFITAIPLILGEGAALTTIIAKTFYLGPALEDLFDEVSVSILLCLTQAELVWRGSLDFAPTGPDQARIQRAGGHHCIGEQSAWKTYYEASQ